MYNKWHDYLVQHSTKSVGDQEFIEFTVDASGIEIEAGTIKSSANINAPWAIKDKSIPDAHMPPYVSSWALLYHPDLIERRRDE